MISIHRLGAAFADLAERWVPSPFVFALVLTLLAGILAFVFVGASVGDVLAGWGNGFWGFLGFGMQMTLVLV
ncbi:TIGR00366 family protein, partial [bacterium]|nr:TIGR00366 family protein [bacterium]